MRLPIIARLLVPGPLGFITRRLRHLIIIPYLILATLLAITVTYLLTSAANRSLTDRFNAQLLDAAQSGGARLVQAEAQQLQALRAIAFTQGFSEAIAAQDKTALGKLASPQAANYDLDSVVVLSKQDKALLTLPQAPGDSITSGEISSDLDAVIRSVLASSGANDKVSAIVENAGGDGTFYTAGPVRQGDAAVGVVLVGTKLSRLLKQIGRDSLSDGTTFYGPSGAPESSVLAGSPQQGAVPALPADWYSQISAKSSGKVRVRTVTVGGEQYVEAFGAVPGLGLEGGSPGVYGVMLRTHALDANLDQTLWAMLPILGVGLALIVVIGLLLASWIDRPLTQLMIASGKVARGDLGVQVPVGRNDELGVLASRFNEMVGGLRQLLFVKDVFGRFVSPEVSAKLLTGQIELGGELREVTILFSDLRNFTALSAERTPAEVVDLLNDYFRIVVRAANRHGGIVNKFGGDSTLIIFGAPVHMPDHADRALATALEMEEALELLSAQRIESGWKPLREGIGIDTGTVVAGQIGSEDRMEYTVIGDAVNVASRLQVTTKSIKGCNVVFSESTLAALADPGAWQWEGKGEIKVQGKQQTVSIYALLGKGMPGSTVEQSVPADGNGLRHASDSAGDTVSPVKAGGVTK